jgi:DNA-binding response OmpR family regulator
LDEDTEAFLGWLDQDPNACSIPTIIVAPGESRPILADIAARARTRRGYLSWPLKGRVLQRAMTDLLEPDGGDTEGLANGHLVLDRRSRILRGRAGFTALSIIECRLAEFLMRQRRRTIPMEDLLTRVFELDKGGNPDLVQVHVAVLKEKMRIVTGGAELIRVLKTHGIVFRRSRSTVGRRYQFLQSA